MTTNNKLNIFFVLTKKHFKTYLGIVVIIFLFILFFQPFAIEKTEFENKLLVTTGFGLIIILLLIILQVVFQKLLLQEEEKNTKNTLLILIYLLSLLISSTLASIFYIYYVGGVNITFIIVVKTIFICFSIPVTMYLKFRFNNFQVLINNLMQEIHSLQNEQKLTKKSADSFIKLISENNSDNFRIRASEIVFIKSADNYVEVGYFDEGKVKKKMIRNKLRNIEQQLSEFDDFIRTHRTSLINIKYIQKLHNNFGNHWLSINNCKETIPVSRQYLISVKDLI